MANIYKSLANIGASMQAPTDAETNQENFNNVNTDGPFIYDGDTTYANGKGSRMLGIDTPEMSSAVALKTERLAKAKESKVGSFASKATAGEAAKLEAQLSVLDADGIDSEGTFVKKDAYGRDIVQNEAYKNRMIEKGYAVPTFFGDENDVASVDAMNKAKEEKRGLWADPEYAKEMAGIVDKRIVNSRAPEEVKNAAGYANYGGTLSREDYSEYAKNKSDSNWIDALQGHVSRLGAGVEYLAAQPMKLFDAEGAKALEKAAKYTSDNAEMLAGYDVEGNGTTSRGWGEAVIDTPKQLLAGAGGVVKGVGTLGGLITGDLEKDNNLLVKVGGYIADTMRDKYSPGLKVSEKEQNEAIAKESGEWGKFFTAASTTVSDPALLSKFIAESVPSLLLGAGAGKLAMSLGGAAKTGVGVSVGTNAALHGADVGQETYDKLVALGDDYWSKVPEYSEMIRSGVKAKDAKADIALDIARSVTAATGTLSAVLQKVAPGGTAIEEALLGVAGKKGLGKALASAGVGVAGEAATGAAEEGSGQFGQNVGVSQIKSDQDLYEGVGQAAGIGLVAEGVTAGAVKTPEVVGGVRDAIISANKEEPKTVEVAPSSEESVNVAKAFANGEDTTSILGSDRTEVEKIKALKEVISILAEKNSLTDDALANIGTQVAEKLPEANLGEIVATGKAIGSLKKSANAVSKEVSEGPKGFLTYYNEAVNAKDEKSFEDNVVKLESFMKSQQDKLNAFNSAEARILAEFQSEADIKDISLEELYKNVKGKATKVDYTYGDNNKKAWVKKEAVLEKFLSGDENFKGSSYAYINDLKNEVGHMELLHKQLVDKALEPVEKTVAPSEVADVAVVEEVNMPVETERQKDIGAGLVDKAPTTAQKEAVKLPENVRKFAETKIGEAKSQKDLDALKTRIMASPNKDVIANREELLKMVDAKVFNDKATTKVEKEDSVMPEMDALISLADNAPSRVGSVQEALAADTRRTEIKTELEDAIASKDEVREAELNAELKDVNDMLDKVNNKVMDNFIKKKVYGSGIRVRNASSVFTPGKLTGLSVSDSVSAESEVVKVKDVMAPVSKKANGEVAFTNSDSPATYFIYDENGEVDPRVAVALVAAGKSYVVDLTDELNRMNDEEFQNRFTLVDVQDPEIAYNWLDRATPLRFEVEKIGDEVIKSLGLKFGDVSMTYEQALKADLGAVAMAILEKDGYVKVGKVGDVHAVSLGTNRNIEGVKNDAMNYENSYGIEFNSGRTFSLSKPKTGRFVEVHNQHLTESTKEQAELINRQESMGYRLNSGFDVLKEVFGSKEGIKKALGKGKAHSSKYNIDAQKSIDREIDNSVDSLFDLSRLKDRDGANVDVWFKWFLSKNGRFVMDSTTVNPQTDKLHRFLVTANSATSEVTEEDIADIKKTESANDKSIMFKYALVQAFDGADGIPAIDKSTKKVVETAANRLMKMEDSELLELVKKLGAEQKGHISHAAIAVSTLRQLREGSTFTSNLTVEFDGLTNGFAFKMLQSPLGDYEKWLPKVGVVTKADKGFSTISTVADLKAGGMLDTYETLGALVEFPDVKEFEYLGDIIKFKGLPDVTNKKAIRNLMKGPVMVFNYGAGTESIAKSITNELLIDAVETIASYSELKKKFGVTSVDFRRVAIGDPSISELVNALKYEISQMYAAPIVGALESEFAATIGYNKAVNGAFGILFNKFAKTYASRVKSLGLGNTLPTKVENDKIVTELLKDFGPIMNGPTTRGELDRILISQRGITDVKELLDSGTAITSIKSSANLNGATATLDIVVRGMGNPGASGGVIPTHTADGTVQGKALKETKGGYLGVHDAMVVGIDQIGSAKEYNKFWYDVNRDYSIVDNVVNEFEKVKDSLTPKERKVLDSLYMYQDIIHGNRAKLFGQDVKIGQMVGIPGSMYEVNVKEKSAKIKDSKEVEVEEPVKGERTDIMKDVNLSGKAVGALINNIKDC